MQLPNADSLRPPPSCDACSSLQRVWQERPAFAQFLPPRRERSATTATTVRCGTKEPRWVAVRAPAALLCGSEQEREPCRALCARARGSGGAPSLGGGAAPRHATGPAEGAAEAGGLPQNEPHCSHATRAGPQLSGPRFHSSKPHVWHDSTRSGAAAEVDSVLKFPSSACRSRNCSKTLMPATGEQTRCPHLHATVTHTRVVHVLCADSACRATGTPSRASLSPSLLRTLTKPASSVTSRSCRRKPLGSWGATSPRRGPAHCHPSRPDAALAKARSSRRSQS